MSVKMSGRLLNNKKLELTHEQSGTVIHTAAPLDNKGDGSSFSPTDLCAVAYPACVLTTMAIIAENKNIDITGAHFTVEKVMNENPRRLGKIQVEMHLPAKLTNDEREKISKAIQACPVHRSFDHNVVLETGLKFDVS